MLWHGRTGTHGCQDKDEEIRIITAPYAVVYPLAVMIASIDTIIALCRRLALTGCQVKHYIPLCSDSTLADGMYDTWDNISQSPWYFHVKQWQLDKE